MQLPVLAEAVALTACALAKAAAAAPDAAAPFPAVVCKQRTAVSYAESPVLYMCDIWQPSGAQPGALGESLHVF